MPLCFATQHVLRSTMYTFLELVKPSKEEQIVSTCTLIDLSLSVSSSRPRKKQLRSLPPTFQPTSIVIGAEHCQGSSDLLARRITTTGISPIATLDRECVCAMFLAHCAAADEMYIETILIYESWSKALVITRSYLLIP